MTRIFLIFSILLITGCSTFIAKQKFIVPVPKNALRFATYNLFCEEGGNKNPYSVIEIIKELKPDIICLQECQCLSKKIVKQKLGKIYPYQFLMHYSDGVKDHEDGLGMLSKYPVVRKYFFVPVHGWYPGWLFVIKTPKGYVQVLNVHLRPKIMSANNIGLFGEALWITPGIRYKEIQYYHRLLNPKLPTIIAGDFNENDQGSACCYLRQHHFYDHLLSIPGYVKTWRWNFAFITLTGRYDRIYSTHNLRCVDQQVLERGSSDHLPVFADFKQCAK